MPLLPSLPDPAHLTDLLVRHPRGLDPLMDLHTAIMRDDGALSIAERELIAAFVSGLNACRFCYGAHAIYARAFGVAEDVLEAMVRDFDHAPVEPRMRPLLAYVKKLTHLPSRLVAADADAVFAAGWSEDALVEAVQVCALFGFMNRLVEGTGVNFDYGGDAAGHTARPGDSESLRESYARYGAMVKAKIAER